MSLFEKVLLGVGAVLLIFGGWQLIAHFFQLCLFMWAHRGGRKCCANCTCLEDYT